LANRCFVLLKKRGNIVKKICTILLIFSFLVLLGCAEKVDLKADQEVLNSMIAEWDRNAKAGNFAALADTYIDNAMLIEDGNVLTGKEAIRNSFQSIHEQYNVPECNNKIEDMRISGDLAVLRGSFSGTFVPKEAGEPINKKGLWVTVYQRQTDGSWKRAYSFGTYIK
jgi:uncharacterized protein (TIGR02246 family)